MSETAWSQTARQPARACTRRSAKRRAGTLRPAAFLVGRAIRSMTEFARMPLPWPAITASISRAVHTRALAASSSRCSRRLRPARAFGWHRAYPAPPSWQEDGGAAETGGPVFTVIRSAGPALGSTPTASPRLRRTMSVNVTGLDRSSTPATTGRQVLPCPAPPRPAQARPQGDPQSALRWSGGVLPLAVPEADDARADRVTPQLSRSGYLP